MEASQVHTDEATLRDVDLFVYLGCELRKVGDIWNEINIKIGKAAAFRDLAKVWNENGTSLRAKLKIFNSIVISLLTYDCESLNGLKEIEERLRRFERGYLRKIVKIIWFDRVNEEQLRRRTRQRSFVEELNKSKWRWYDHVLRMPDHRISEQAIHWRPAGRRRVGRPEYTWQRTIEREKREGGLNLEDVEARAQDRDAWRELIADLWSTRVQRGLGK